jgi:hypothetical protein
MAGSFCFSFWGNSIPATSNLGNTSFLADAIPGSIANTMNTPYLVVVFHEDSTVITVLPDLVMRTTEPAALRFNNVSNVLSHCMETHRTL